MYSSFRTLVPVIWTLIRLPISSTSYDCQQVVDYVTAICVFVQLKAAYASPQLSPIHHAPPPACLGVEPTATVSAGSATSSTGVLDQQFGGNVGYVTALLTATVNAGSAASSTGVLDQEFRASVEDVTALPTATVSAGSATSSTGLLDQQFWDVSVVDDMLSVFSL